MSLRNKTYLLLLAVTAIFFLIIYGLTWWATEEQLSELQRAHAEEQLALTERILDREVEGLSIKQADWARWDDTYEFMADRNEEYIASNLNDESLDLINVDMMVFVNNAGEIVYGKQVYENKPGETAIPESILSYFRGKSELIDFGGDLIAVKRGILTLPNIVLLVSAQPVSTSDGKGVRRGTLIFGRYLDTQYENTLSQLSGLRVRLKPYGPTADSTGLRSDVRTMITYADGNVIASRSIENIFGNPSLQLEVTYPARTMDQGNKFLLNGIWYALIAFISYTSILIILIDIFLLRRIENMRRIVRQASVLQTGELPKGDIDDFSYLATVVMNATKHIQATDDILNGNRGELEKFKTAFDQGFDHMIITDIEGKILYANVAAEQLTGYSREEMIGETPSLWGRQMPKKFYQDFWDTIRVRKEAFFGEVTNRHKNGTRYRVLIRVTPILGRDKKILYFVGIERPIENGTNGIPLKFMGNVKA